MCRVAIVAATLVLFASHARAQSLGRELGSPTGEPSAPMPEDISPAAPSFTVQTPVQTTGAPPDLVLTLDGGMVRGTIVSSQPGRSVVIQLMTGELREIAWDEVRFAGRAPEAPRTNAVVREPEPERSVRRGVPVRFLSNQRLTLHSLDGSATLSSSGGGITVHGRADYYARTCTAPCEFTVDPGVHRFGLSIGGGGPRFAGAVDITRPTTLRGTHVDHGGLRGAGGMTFAAGVAAAAGLITFALLEGNLDALIAGSVLGGIGLGVGIPLMAMRSGLVLTFE